MQRHADLGVLLAVAGLAACLCAPPPASPQELKAVSDAKAMAGKEKEGKAPPRVSLLSLQLVKSEPAPGNAPAAFLGMRRFGFPNQSLARPGTTLTFLVEDPDRLIEGIETKDCRITTFRDDKGTDLLKDPAPAQEDGVPSPPSGQPTEDAFWAEADLTGHRATVTVHSPHLPSSSSSKILLEANLVLKYMRGEKIIEQKNVNLKLDKITAGPVPLVIASQSGNEAMMMMGRQPGFQAAMQVTVFHQGPQLGVRKLAFIGPDGNEIKSRPSGGGSSGTIHHANYQLEGKFDTCTVQITVPDVIESATVAISVNTGLGFPPGVRRRFVPAPGPGASAGDAPPR
jgi:hypothetical protein